MSTHNLIFSGLLAFGKATIGLTHGVVPLAGSIMSNLCSLSNSAATFSRIAKGMRLVGETVGLTSLFMRRFKPGFH